MGDRVDVSWVWNPDTVIEIATRFVAEVACLEATGLSFFEPGLVTARPSQLRSRFVVSGIGIAVGSGLVLVSQEYVRGLRRIWRGNLRKSSGA